MLEKFVWIELRAAMASFGVNFLMENGEVRRNYDKSFPKELCEVVEVSDGRGYVREDDDLCISG